MIYTLNTELSNVELASGIALLSSIPPLYVTTDGKVTTNGWSSDNSSKLAISDDGTSMDDIADFMITRTESAFIHSPAAFDTDIVVFKDRVELGGKTLFKYRIPKNDNYVALNYLNQQSIINGEDIDGLYNLISAFSTIANLLAIGGAKIVDGKIESEHDLSSRDAIVDLVKRRARSAPHILHRFPRDEDAVAFRKLSSAIQGLLITKTVLKDGVFVVDGSDTVDADKATTLNPFILGRSYFPEC